MSEDGRRRAFALAAALVLAAVALFWALGPQEDLDEPGRRGGRAKPVIVADARTPAPAVSAEPAVSPDPTVPGDDDAGPAAAPAAADERDGGGRKRVDPALDAVARSFLGAYMRFEVGDDPSVVRRTLRASATPALARFLLRQPPRRPLGAERPGKARVVRLESVNDPQDPSRHTVVATLQRGERVSALRLELEERDGAWLVTAVG